MNSLAKNFIGLAIGGTGALAYLGIKKPWKKAAEPESRTLVNQESADIQKTLTSTDEDAFGEVKAKESQQFLDEVAEPKKSWVFFEGGLGYLDLLRVKWPRSVKVKWPRPIFTTS